MTQQAQEPEKDQKPEHKTCIICRAKVPVDAEGNIPEGGMPCGH